MDLISLIGTILAFVVIIVGTILKGSTVEALWNPAAFVIVIVGTFAALMVQTPGKDLKRAASLFPQVFKPRVPDYNTIVSDIMEWSQVSRKQGLLGLEQFVATTDDPFVKAGLQMVVDGSEPAAIRSALEIQRDALEHEQVAGAKVYENAGTYSPTMGIIGAVMGLMAVMQNLADPSKLGHGIAAAFVATIYGVALANLWMLPMASRLKSQIHKEAQSREMVIEGLMSIAAGVNPKIIEAKLQAFIP